MKKLFGFLLGLSIIMFFGSCEGIFNDDELKGDQSPMGEVGVTVSSSSAEISGVSNFNAVVAGLKDGVSTYTGSATVTNAYLKNLLSNIPGIEISGDVVTGTDIEFKNTKEGVEFLTGPTKGIWVKYDSKVGDTYPVGSTGNVRTVVSKTGVDDYSYGFFLIKVVKVEEIPTSLKSTGITKITYIANHKYGLVGVNFEFDDGSSAEFPLYFSAEN
jgi:hypothetical protein